MTVRDQPSSYDSSIAYINGHMYTIDSSNPWASAFVVSRDGFFVYVGTTEEVRLLARQHRLITVDLKNRFVMPGIHDAHMHLLFSGLGLTSEGVLATDTTHVNFASRVKEGCCACEYINAYQDWVLAGTFRHQNFPDGIVDRKYLDELYPDTPVLIRGGEGHAMLLNTAGLKRAGYDPDNEPDVQGAKFFRRPDGSLTGQLAEDAMAKAALALPPLDRAHVKRVLRHAIHLAHKAGVTSTQEAGTNTVMIKALSELDEENKLKLEVFTHILYNFEGLAGETKESLQELQATAEQYESKRVHTGFIKVLLDGIPVPPYFTQSSLDEHGCTDHSKILSPNIADTVAKFDKLGRTVKIHCTGNGSTRLALDAFEAARKQHPSGPRHEIAHNNGVHDG